MSKTVTVIRIVESNPPTAVTVDTDSRTDDVAYQVLNAVEMPTGEANYSDEREEDLPQKKTYAAVKAGIVDWLDAAEDSDVLFVSASGCDDFWLLASDDGPGRVSELHVESIMKPVITVRAGRDKVKPILKKGRHH